MPQPPHSHPTQKNAPSRAFFHILTSLTFLLLSCKKSQQITPTWNNSPPPIENSSHQKLPKLTPLRPLPFRFLSWNAQNWSHDRDGKTNKSPQSKQAAATLLALANPDAIGLCEIGSPQDLQEIQQLLATQGISLPHAYFSRGGLDNQRHLAFLSRFPITTNPSTFPLRWQHGKNQELMRRGICDLTLTIQNQKIRLLGVHLKSKFEGTSQLPTEDIRLAESNLLRQTIQTILTQNPQTPLLVYGDFNDTPRSPTIHLLRSAHPWLAPITPQDSRGETWTHHWDDDQLYSHIDWIWLTKNLRTRLSESKILDNAPLTQLASDHRPILLIFE